MTAIKSLIKVPKSLDAITENEDLITVAGRNGVFQQEVAMSPSVITNQIEQRYYNKASGCSVRAQKDNLFDYKSWLKN